MLKNVLKVGQQYIKFKLLRFKKIQFVDVFVDVFVWIILSIVLKLCELAKINLFIIYNNKIFFRGNNYPILRINGSLMKIDLKDKGLSKELFIYKEREHFSTEFIKNFIEEDDVILEIGANKGYYAFLEAKIAKKGKIYAIEPIQENFSLLAESIKLNSFNNIILFPNLALSDKSGEKIMYFNTKHNLSSFIQHPIGKCIEERKISTLTIDEFIKRINSYPSFIRMDVEGHEYEIIKGASETLKKSKKLRLFIEIHAILMSKEKVKYILDTLQNNNFKIKIVFHELQPQHYRFIRIFNHLAEKTNIPKYGKLEISNYKELEDALNNSICLECFFKKEI